MRWKTIDVGRIGARQIAATADNKSISSASSSQGAGNGKERDVAPMFNRTIIQDTKKNIYLHEVYRQLLQIL